MTHVIRRSRLFVPVLLLVLGALTAPIQAQEKRTLTYAELMQFRQIEHPSISADGRWVTFAAVPDRGDSEVIIRSTEDDTRHVVALGDDPTISPDSRWVAMRLTIPLEAREQEGDSPDPRPGMALVNVETGEVTEADEVRSFAFSGDGAWLAYLLHPPREGEDEDDESAEGEAPEEAEPTGEEEPEGGAAPGDGADADEDSDRELGSVLVLRSLADGAEERLENVREYAFDESGRFLAYAVADPAGEADALRIRSLAGGDGNEESGDEAVDVRPQGHFSSLAWSEDDSRLSWLSAQEDDEGEPGSASLKIWSGGDVDTALEADHAPDGWYVPAENNPLRWSEDGERIFFGFRPEHGGSEDMNDEENDFDPYDLDAILEGREVDVWHTDDPLIIPNQKEQWQQQTRRTWAAVHHLDSGRTVQLSTQELDLSLSGLPENDRVALASHAEPYFKERTWVGFQSDVYVVGLEDGQADRVVQAYQGGGSTVQSWTGWFEPPMSLSPQGRYLAYFHEGDWHLYDTDDGTTRNLTAGMDVSFADVDHDYRQPVGGYGVGRWVEDDQAVLIHDKYDLWMFSTDPDEAPVNVTAGQGRARNRIYRAFQWDPEQDAVPEGGAVALRSFHEFDKSMGFHSASLSEPGVTDMLVEDKRFSFVAKAEDASVVLYTREAYDEFPDLWIADSSHEYRRITDVNPQLEEFAWGEAELVEWLSDDGVPLQGVVIKPGNYEEGKRYPVMTYFYRFFSQRLHEFNEPVVNHRPSFPIYASDGYIVFLPDVRFELGRPGMSAVKAVVPGVKKLVDMGLADPDALGLHGHSWSGYTTAYIVTQSNIFAAAVAGAPVSNMTSAYGGIRWGSGLARQFQYEQSQSRLRGSLWEARQDYILNSPLFYADRIDTPLLIQHGDEDGAVPWYQSIELYLALRRLGKDAVFLQYRGEPHHLQKYANKLDYSIKMKDFFDHHLKGEPAPDWWAEGVPYHGR